MTTDRIASIQSLLAKNGDDVFLHYSLAMEYASAKQWEPAVAEFHKCLELDAGYLAAYVEAGKCLLAAGRCEDAREMLLNALNLAERQGKNHTRDTIQQQLDSLPRKT